LYNNADNPNGGPFLCHVVEQTLRRGETTDTGLMGIATRTSSCRQREFYGGKIIIEFRRMPIRQKSRRQKPCPTPPTPPRR
jgi:hypothetical protein